MNLRGPLIVRQSETERFRAEKWVSINPRPQLAPSFLSIVLARRCRLVHRSRHSPSLPCPCLFILSSKQSPQSLVYPFATFVDVPTFVSLRLDKSKHWKHLSVLTAAVRTGMAESQLGYDSLEQGSNKSERTTSVSIALQPSVTEPAKRRLLDLHGTHTTENFDLLLALNEHRERTSCNRVFSR